MGAIHDLPNELMDEIFTSLKGDNSALTTCALVNRDWNKAARKLFPVTSCSIQTHSAVSLSKLLAPDNCTLSKNIEYLTVNGAYAGAPPDWRWNTSVQKIVQHFEGITSQLTLKHLSIKIADGNSKDEFMYNLRQSAASYLRPSSILKRLFRGRSSKSRPQKYATLRLDPSGEQFSPRCTNVELNDIRFRTIEDMMTCISFLPTLHSIGVADVEITHSKTMRPTPLSMDVPSPFSSLKSLRLVGPGPATQAVVSTICSQPTIEIERCSLRDPMWSDTEVSVHRPVMDKFLDRVSPQLKGLHLAFDLKGSNYLDTLNLAPYISLENLSMYLTLTPFFISESSYDAFGVIRTLPPPSKASVLSTVTLYIHFEFYHLQDIAEKIGPGMHRIDEFLAKREGMKDVVVILLSVFSFIMPDSPDAKAVVDKLMPLCKSSGILSVGAVGPNVCF